MLDDAVDKYNNTVDTAIKMKPIDDLILMLNTMNILMKPGLNSKLVIMLEFRNTKTFLLKDTLKIGPKKFLLLVKLKIKRPHIRMSQYFPKLFRSFWGNINVKVDLSNYATKADLKNVTLKN